MRPYVDDELGIPFDEAQLAGLIALEGYVMHICLSRTDDEAQRAIHRGLYEARVDDLVRRFHARAASETLRKAVRSWKQA